MIVYKKPLKTLAVIVFILLLTSCDFKPEGYQIYTGKEPVLNLHISGMQDKILHFDVLNTRLQFAKTSSSDTLHSKAYVNAPNYSLLRLYVAPDSLGYNSLEDVKEPIFKILNSFDLEITGDVSNGLTFKNISQTEDDKTMAKFYRKLEEFKLKIEKASGENFDYGNYRKTYDSINRYLKANVNMENIKILPLLITYVEIAASTVPVSKTFIYDRLSYSYRNSDLYTRMADFYFYSFLTQPPYSIDEQITELKLNQKLSDNPFFKSPYPKKLRILITDALSNQEDQLKLYEIERELRERFDKDLDILTVPNNETIRQPGYFESLFEKDKRAKFNSKTRPLTTTIIDEDNRVLLNTMADEHLELKVESILKYLEKQSEKQDVVKD